MIALAFPVVAPPAAAHTPVVVPSGQPVSLSEVLLDDAPGEPWLRFRFLAPSIARDGGTVDFETASGDIAHLCAAMVVPYVALHDLDPARVVISLSDRDVAFGETDPEATQFFESYRLDDGACVWEEY